MIFLKKEINLSYFKKHFILLFIILILIFGLIYFYFIYDKKNYILNSPLVSHDDDYWYYDGQWTCVNFGKPGEKCDVNKGVCNVNGIYGNLEDQKLMVENAGKNKNKIHDLCPIIY